MDRTKVFINTIMELWLMIYDTGQEMFVFFTTPVNEMASASGNEDFFGILGGISYTPFELIFGFGLLSTLFYALLRFFKIDFL